MGNDIWKGISYQKFEEAEERMLKHTGIEERLIHRSNVVIDNDNNYIRTIEIGRENQKILVLIHGYGCSSIFFYKIVNRLVYEGKFRVFLVDILGMGGSSRPNFMNIVQECVDRAEDFLVSWLEQWRVNVGDIKDFYLAGHSFGGYVSGLYALKYQKYVKKLLLLSPLGVAKKPNQFNVEEYMIENLPEDRRLPKIMYSLADKIYENRWSPFEFMRKTGRLGTQFLIQLFAKKRLSNLPINEITDFKDYLHQIILRDPSTEYAVFICFEKSSFAKTPLCGKNRLQMLDIPVSFVYGDGDWMPRDGFNEVLKRNKHEVSQIYFVKNSDHHMYFDNPDELTNIILEDIEMTERYLKQIKNQDLLIEEVY